MEKTKKVLGSLVGLFSFLSLYVGGLFVYLLLFTVLLFAGSICFAKKFDKLFD